MIVANQNCNQNKDQTPQLAWCYTGSHGRHLEFGSHLGFRIYSKYTFYLDKNTKRLKLHSNWPTGGWDAIKNQFMLSQPIFYMYFRRNGGHLGFMLIKKNAQSCHNVNRAKFVLGSLGNTNPQKNFVNNDIARLSFSQLDYLDFTRTHLAGN